MYAIRFIVDPLYKPKIVLFLWGIEIMQGKMKKVGSKSSVVIFDAFVTIV